MRHLAGLVLALLATAPLPALAASVEILVLDEGGAPLDSIDIDLKPGPDTPRHKPRHLHARTGLAGVASFRDIVAGEYDIRASVRPPLVSAVENPLAPPPHLTVLATDTQLRARLELRRGLEVRSEIRLNRGDPPPAELVFTFRETGFRIRRAIGPGVVSALVTLIPGRWTARLEGIRTGHIIADIARDGAPLHGDDVLLEIDPDERRSPMLEWRLSAVAHVWGRLDPGTEMEATLVEPGPAWAAAKARGGSPPARLALPRLFDGRRFYYDAVMPDGLWHIAPVAPQATEPEAADVQFAAGSDEERDFRLLPGGLRSAHRGRGS